MKLFVYGSLKRGFYNHPLLSKAKFISRAVTTEQNFIMSGAYSFPVVHYSKQAKWGYVEGELFDVDKETLLRVDRLEGHPNWYRRHITSVCTNEKVYPTVIMYVQDLDPMDIVKREEMRFNPPSYSIMVDNQGNQSWEFKITTLN